MSVMGFCPECNKEVWAEHPDSVQDPLTLDWYHDSCLVDRMQREEAERDNGTDVFNVDGENLD